MEFISLKIAGLVFYTALVWYVGSKYTQYNSVSDIAGLFKDAAAKLDALKVNVAEEAKAAEDKAASLKALL